MEAAFFHTEQDKNYIVLDPRTKLLLLITISTIMLGTGNSGILNIIKPILSIVPFLLLFSERRIQTAGKYMALYVVCFLLERIAATWATGMVSFLLLAVSSIMTKFAPGIMTGAFLLSTTTVSEFVAAMERMHISEKIVIPLSVIFRFIPTIKEEYQFISDAMKMRGIQLGKGHLLQMIEYRMIPLMISVVKIGDELSAAALTRGLGAPVKRTNICKIGFHMQDIALMLLCVFCLMLCFTQS